MACIEWATLRGEDATCDTIDADRYSVALLGPKLRSRASPLVSGQQDRAPLAGEVASHSRRSVLLEMPHEADDDNSAISPPHCEIEKTNLGGAEGECQNLGEVLYRGALLCGSHAALLELEERAQAVLGSVFQMDEWLEDKAWSRNGGTSADEEFVGRIQYERDEALAALRLLRQQIRSAREALSVGR
jgi:hypothetical protein